MISQRQSRTPATEGPQGRSFSLFQVAWSDWEYRCFFPRGDASPSQHYPLSCFYLRKRDSLERSRCPRKQHGDWARLRRQASRQRPWGRASSETQGQSVEAGENEDESLQDRYRRCFLPPLLTATGSPRVIFGEGGWESDALTTTPKIVTSTTIKMPITFRNFVELAL